MLTLCGLALRSTRMTRPRVQRTNCPQSCDLPKISNPHNSKPEVEIDIVQKRFLSVGRPLNNPQRPSVHGHRKWEISKTCFLVFFQFSYAKTTNFRRNDFSSLPLNTSILNPLSPPISVATRGPYFGSNVPPKLRPSENFKPP